VLLKARNVEARHTSPNDFKTDDYCITKWASQFLQLNCAITLAMVDKVGALALSVLFGAHSASGVVPIGGVRWSPPKSLSAPDHTLRKGRYLSTLSSAGSQDLRMNHFYFKKGAEVTLFRTTLILCIALISISFR
jgi:hypothetical protein